MYHFQIVRGVLFLGFFFLILLFSFGLEYWLTQIIGRVSHLLGSYEFSARMYPFRCYR